MRPLDRTDIEILAALQKNGRLPNKELAARVGIAPSTCLERVRRLREDGVLLGVHARVDPKALAIGLQALLAVRLRTHSHEQIAAFRRHVEGLEEVIGFYHVAGANDYLLQVAVRDPEHLRQLALDSFSVWSEVDHLETALIYEHWRKPVLPSYADPEE